MSERPTLSERERKLLLAMFDATAQPGRPIALAEMGHLASVPTGAEAGVSRALARKGLLRRETVTDDDGRPMAHVYEITERGWTLAKLILSAMPVDDLTAGQAARIGKAREWSRSRGEVESPRPAPHPDEEHRYP